MSSILVGVIHLPPLPGSPRAALPMDQIVEGAVADARALADGGFSRVMIENFGDAPFFRGRAPAVTVSAMTACILAVRHALPSLSLGVNVLRNDGESAVEIAHVTGAKTIRVNILAGARVTDQGIIQGESATLLRRRRELGADNVEIWADVDVKHSAPLAPYPLDQEVKDVTLRALASAVLVTGEGTGHGVDVDKLSRVRRAAGSVPVLVASGATLETLPQLAEHASGVIVGSALRADGRAGGPIDAARAAAFAKAFAASFG
jgi:hypothetical protein